MTATTTEDVSTSNSKTKTISTFVFKLQDLDCNSVRITSAGPRDRHYYYVVDCDTYQKRPSVAWTLQQTVKPSTPPTTTHSGQIWYVNFAFNGKDSAKRFARALKHAIVKSGAKPDPFAENCENVDVRVQTPIAPPDIVNGRQTRNAKPVESRAPLPAPAAVKVSLEYAGGKPYLVIDNTASDRAADVSYSADYRDSSGRWFNKIRGTMRILGRKVFRTELWNQDAQEWKVEKLAEATVR